MDIKNIKIFRYKTRYWDEIEEIEKTDFGFASGFTIGDAVDRIESIYKKPNNDSLMTDIFIYEVESYDSGVLTDETINETRMAEEK